MDPNEDPRWYVPSQEECAAAPKMNGNKDWCEGIRTSEGTLIECNFCNKYVFRKEYE